MAIFPYCLRIEAHGWARKYATRIVHATHADLTLTQSKVRVTGLLKFRKLQFSRSISAILAWSSKLMVDHDSTGT